MSTDAREVLGRILTALTSDTAPLGRSLYPGEAGVALCLAQGSRVFGDQAAWEAGLVRLERAFEDPSPLPTFAGGFFGVMWAGQMLAELGADVDADVDEIIDRLLAAAGERDEFDLFNGWVGLGVYALARRGAPGGRDRLAAVVRRLGVNARRDSDGAAWFRTLEMTPLDSRHWFPRGHYNLGVSHGQAGVVGFLADVIASGADIPEAGALLDEAVAWWLAQRRTEPGRAFPAMLDAERAELAGDPEAWLYGDTGRESWSYGDLGQATALLAAARARGRADWERVALEVARRAALRTDPEDVRWGYFCHGQAGVAYLLHRLHVASGDPLFGERADAWARASWARLPRLQDRDLMYGDAGVGLLNCALLSARAAAWETAFAVGATALGVDR